MRKKKVRKEGENMKKYIVLAVLLVVTTLLLCSCGNRQVGIDTAQSFKRALVKLNDKWEEFSVKAWRDFDKSDCVQFTAEDGTVYLTHYCNVVLISK